MGKFNGGIYSKVKGKIAGVVFQQYEGMQIGKEYQPNVKNPGTTNQVANRARFKAASQLVAVFATIFAIAASRVSPYVRVVRGSLVRVLRGAFAWDAENNTASITTSATAEAVNTLNLNPSINPPVITGSVMGTATINAEVDDVVRYKIVALDGEGVTIGQAEETFTATASPVTIVAPLVSGTPHKYVIAAVAMRSVGGEGTAMYDNLLELNLLEVAYGVNAGNVVTSNVVMSDIAQS